MAEACQRAAPTIKQYLEQAFAVTHELENRLTVLVKYTFRKEIAELKGDQPMKYGRGTVEYATLGLPGKDMPITVPTWMRLDVTLDATCMWLIWRWYLEGWGLCRLFDWLIDWPNLSAWSFCFTFRKRMSENFTDCLFSDNFTVELKKLVEDTRRGPDQPVGFAVPWKATLSFVGIKSDFDPHYGYGSLDSVTMSFICPDGTGTVRHPFSHSDCWMSRHQPRQPPPVSLAGTTYSECCEELGIFREAYVYVKYHILWREFIRMSLRTIQPSLFDVECLLLGDRKAVTERVVRARVANVVMPVAPGTLNLVSIDGKAYSVDIPVISAYISPTVLAEFERQTAKREVVRVPYPAWLIEAVIVGLYDAGKTLLDQSFNFSNFQIGNLNKNLTVWKSKDL